MSTRYRALMLSAIGGLLLATSATAAFAMTPIRVPPIAQEGFVGLSSPTLDLRNAKAIQIANDELGDGRWTPNATELFDVFDVAGTEALQAIDLSSSYDGKTIPI